MDGNSKRKDPENVEEHEEDAAPSTQNALVVKKQKTGAELVVRDEPNSKAVTTTVQRTSNLQAPIMLLTGHKAEVFSIKFSPSGKHIASGSFDKCVYLWNVYGDCENYMVLRGHTNAVLEVAWSYDESYIFSSSADKTVAVWDAETGQRIKKYTGHTGVVNSVSPTRKGVHYLVSGSDDSTVKVWDLRLKRPIANFETQYATTSVTFSQDGEQVYSGGIDNDIKVWNVRQGGIENRYEGHEDSITGLKLSPDGNYLLTNSMDNSVRIWDVKPYVKGSRCIKTFQGIQHNFEKTLLRCSWSPDGKRISAGSADRFVYVWDTTTRKIVYKLPGHRGSVNDCDFHPNEPIIGSASSDKTIYLGEIKY